MAIKESLLPEFDMEMANTRKVLDRVPDGKFAWKPHDKSFSMGDLAVHLTQLPTWTNVTMDTSELDLSQPWEAPKIDTKAALLKAFDETVSNARKALESASDAAFMETWTLKSGNTTHFTLPKVAVLRSFVMNHMIHHRAQLGVYLRMNDVPVPSTYGPSADEGEM